jgi:Pyruvate/2-oxoacid:ferredoxin oxidoreductase delta subunit
VSAKVNIEEYPPLLIVSNGDEYLMPKRNDWTRTQLEREVKRLTAVTVPVNMLIKGQQRILCMTEMEGILREATLIGLGDCGCRTKLKRCDSPLDVCLTLDKDAQDAIKRGNAKGISLAEAFDVLKRSHEAGLVHIAYTFKGKEKPGLVCSCCSCCCQSMSALVRFGMPTAVVSSKYVANNNRETCISCGKCVERCQFKARHLEDGKMVFDAARCFGCGLCLTKCPTASISLIERAS